ncbi:hypothetical protein K469DRAFT_718934 [Zopfia rhizophila CBS 207.26]|uniref:Uncharacterized protein n=1 Tax=Zopfia rhizophila CBS 207.26 TaxID=1314779 RepID=A0A6A6EJN2_9PEZI|nr:hypothetical protein K469DRAFT_718934 [Zopfia rhizophila CBS 207.26]
MAPNDDDSRRNRDRPEDNPFIAFRRFADSHVSSLLHTVFTLPSTIANFNNAHHAREQCLFGQADPAQCEKLARLEGELARIRAEGRESFRIGDVQAVLEKGEELMKIEDEVDGVRRDIVEGVRNRALSDGDSRKHTEMVEKVGTEKGQRWGWSWSWGFPGSFSDDEPTLLDKTSEDDHRHRRMCRRQRRKLDEVEPLNPYDGDWGHFNAKWEEIKRRMNEEVPRSENGEPRVWTWSWSWPPRPSDDTPSEAQHNERHNENPQGMFDEIGNMIVDEVTRMMLPHPFTYQYPSYSPRALEENEELKKAGIQWRDAFEDLVRAERGAPLLPSQQLGHSSRLPYNQWVRRFQQRDFHLPEFPEGVEKGEYPKRVPWEGEEDDDEPEYEYGHDHEDQHDDPPTPKSDGGKFTEGIPPTELDAYERLLDPPSPPNPPNEPQNATRPSVLSTLTTTERTVHPDGTVTTKVVLKKRFADGKEESSETVHTQRGQDSDSPANDPWKPPYETQPPPVFKTSEIPPPKKEQEKKSGWFWSN